MKIIPLILLTIVSFKMYSQKLEIGLQTGINKNILSRGNFGFNTGFFMIGNTINGNFVEFNSSYSNYKVYYEEMGTFEKSTTYSSDIQSSLSYNIIFNKSKKSSISIGSGIGIVGSFRPITLNIIDLDGRIRNTFSQTISFIDIGFPIQICYFKKAAHNKYIFGLKGSSFIVPNSKYTTLGIQSFIKYRIGIN